MVKVLNISVKYLAAIAIFIITAAIGQNSTIVVNIKNGPIVGEKREQYYAFEGIPYAKPPLGALRFAPSELNDDRWIEPRDVTQPGSKCLQWTHFNKTKEKLIGTEDCLFLNVYTRSTDRNARLPSIVFIHGGGFMFSTSSKYRPDHILGSHQSVILVTFNYRLGPLGFLSTEDDVIPGNYGLKDQVTALRWVRENIQSFGGDPSTITLVGYSAGSASVHLHYLSPLSEGLFSSGIGHSGTALNPWTMAEQSTEKARQIGVALDCPTRKTQALLDCLRKVPAEDIVRQVANFLDFLYNPFSPFGVVVEKEGPLNLSPFITDTPRSLMKTGRIAKAPLILSTTQAEGLYPGAEFISNPTYLQQIDSRWNELVPSILDYKTAIPDAKERDQLSETIRNHYFQADERLTSENFYKFIRILSNRLYFVGFTESIKLMQPHIKVYSYVDYFKIKYGLSEKLSRCSKMRSFGVSHGEDVDLIFHSIVREHLPYTIQEQEVIERFVTMYNEFAKRGIARFGSYVIPLQNTPDRITYLKIDYPYSKVVRAEAISDETFWNGLDFHDAPYE